MKQVTLLGVSQIGASIGLGLRAEHARKYRVVGYDPDQDIHAQAEKIGAVDSAEWNLDTAVRDADVVIISLTGDASLRDFGEHRAVRLRQCHDHRHVQHQAFDTPLG